MNLTGQSFIGASRGSETERTSCGVNPSTGEKNTPSFFYATNDEVEQAISLASEAFLVLKQTSGAKKASLLRSIADKLNDSADTIAELGPLETGLPEMRMRGELGRTMGQLRLFADLVEEGSWVDARIENAMPDRQPMPKSDIRSMHRPLGPVAVFTASNFPLAFSVAGGDTASALASGCPVVVKAHQSHPVLSEIVAGCIAAAVKECGLPEGTFSMLFGSGREVGQALVKHPAIKAVGFTGSFAGGKALMDAAAARPEPIPVYTEMSSINPVCILPSAIDREGLASGLFQSLTLGAGQFCTNPGLVFIPKGKSQAFIDALVALASEQGPATMLNASICQAYQDGLSQLDAHDGVTTLLKPDSAEGCTAQPAIFLTDPATFASGKFDEVFGPATILVEYEDEAALSAACAALEGQLTASIFADAGESFSLSGLIAILEMIAGRVIFNEFPTGVEVCHAMVHGGPFPATSDGRSTSVGSMAIHRFTRPVCYQGWSSDLLPAELKDANPLNINRTVDGALTPKS